ncbi:hypothetical protein OIU78_023012 [Salix suchowensis]|nr:hypothetical protein OIU78_023012 [Salix suchowensis]
MLESRRLPGSSSGSEAKRLQEEVKEFSGSSEYTVTIFSGRIFNAFLRYATKKEPPSQPTSAAVVLDFSISTVAGSNISCSS